VLTVESRRARFRRLINGAELVICPGVVNALSARIAEAAGFELIYATGAGIANAHLGVPDIGLLTMMEVLETDRRIAQSVSIPVLADIDTGYGGAFNVYRTVREFEAGGLAGIQIEDQINPKRCGHFDNKEVVSLSEMLERLIAAREARTDPDLVIVARTDSLATHGVDEAIRRANFFVEAGADVVFVEGPELVEDVRRIPREVAAPVLINVVEGGRTPNLPPTELSAMGYRIALYANTVLRAATAASATALEVLRRTGETKELMGSILSWEARQKLVGLDEWLELGNAIADTAQRIIEKG
jgi:2-methylisocitrate lyase-like PEP mutase family enzyme